MLPLRLTATTISGDRQVGRHDPDMMSESVCRKVQQYACVHGVWHARMHPWHDAVAPGLVMKADLPWLDSSGDG